ncbi:MAG: tellurite resistance protein, partial [Solirubrobacteraceae bacterium]|nr:tellurite resistance protein [Solirubrobacteraceae bacterium]
MHRLGRKRLERLADGARIVALRHVGADEAPDLTAQPVGRRLGGLLRVAPGRVRGDEPSVEEDRRVGHVRAGGLRADPAQREPGTEHGLVDVAVDVGDGPARDVHLAAADLRVRMDLDLDAPAHRLASRPCKGLPVRPRLTACRCGRAHEQVGATARAGGVGAPRARPTAGRMTTTAAAPPRAPVERAAPLLGVRPNAFAAPLGILGLAGVWRAMQQAEGWPGWVADALCRRGRRESPFSPLPFIVLMLLAATGLASHASGAADVLLAVGLTCSLLLGAWLTGEWVAGPIDPRRAHPGYFIPALGPGMIGALTAGTLGHANLAWMCLGLGLLSWIMLGSVILHRLMFGPELPAPLGATLAIEIAPPAVAATAYLTLDGGRVDPILLGLSGFCVLMVLGQVRLLPIYRRVP